MKKPILKRSSLSNRTNMATIIFFVVAPFLGCQGPAGKQGTQGVPGVGTNGTNGANGAPGISSGTIVLTLTDQTGAVIVGASVTTDPASVTVSTNAAGVATVDNVPIGVYAVFGQKNGYKAFEAPEVSVTAGSTVTLAGVLAPGTPWTLIDVVGISGPEGDTDTSPDTRVTLTGSVLDKSIVTNGLRNVGVGNYGIFNRRRNR